MKLKYRFHPLVFLVLTSLSLSAQLIPNASSAIDKGRSAIKTISLTGTVVTQDGSPPAGGGEAILKCGTEQRAVTHLDVHGSFAMLIGVGNSNPATNLGHENAAVPISALSDCEVSASIPGYSSETVRLFGVAEEVVQVGRIIVHPLGPAHGGGSVSVTSLAAPEKAKQAFEKGKEQEKKGKWASACDSFKRAIAVYPRYALAWLELGRSQAKQNSLDEAQQSFHHAVSEDSHLVAGYLELAHLDVNQKRWKDLADTTDHLVQISPDSAPEFWFLNSAAHFNLGNKKQAETSAERGLRLDRDHHVPQLEYLYGLALADQHDCKAAVPHFAAYLQLSPQASDAQAARSKMAECERLTQTEETASR